MVEHAKQNGGLNGAYYGPAISPHHSNRSIGRGSSGCCTPCSLLCSLFKLLLLIVVILGIIVLVLWLVLRPKEIKSYAESATLTKFDLSNNTISYNFTVDLSIRNPNKRVAIYYDRVEATASYDGNRIAYDKSLPTFFQDHKNTTMIHPSFDGQQVVVSDSLATAFNKDKEEGFFDVDVKVNLKVRFKVWFVKTNKYSPKIKCSLKLPVPASTGVSSDGFGRTKCHVDFI